ncbi:MAG: hypothetical protein RSE51_10145 [Bacteroidales bacterium]
MSIPFMGNKLYTHIFINLLLLFLSSACNQEVFVDRLEPVANRLQLSGEGDTAIVRISSSDWFLVRAVLDTPHYYDLFCNKYDENDRLIEADVRLADAWIDDKGKIVVEGEYIDLTLKRTSDKELQVIVGTNFLETDLQIQIEFWDRYMMFPLTLTQAVSAGYVLDSIVYTFLPSSYHTYLVEGKSRIHVNNNSTQPISFSYYVFSGETGTVRFKSDNQKAFYYLKELENKVVYPQTVVDSELVLSNDKISFESSSQQRPHPFEDVMRTIQIPVGGCEIVPFLEFEEYKARFSLYVKDKRGGTQKCITGIFESKMPTGKNYYSLIKHEE